MVQYNLQVKMMLNLFWFNAKEDKAKILWSSAPVGLENLKVQKSVCFLWQDNTTGRDEVMNSHIPLWEVMFSKRSSDLNCSLQRRNIRQSHFGGWHRLWGLTKWKEQKTVACFYLFFFKGKILIFSEIKQLKGMKENRC